MLKKIDRMIAIRRILVLLIDRRSIRGGVKVFSILSFESISSLEDRLRSIHILL